MKVLVRGTAPDRRFVAFCNNCSSLIEANATELTIIPGDYRAEHFAWAACSVCGEKACFHAWDSASGRADRNKAHFS